MEICIRIATKRTGILQGRTDSCCCRLHTVILWRLMCVCLCLKARRVCRLCCGTSDMNMGWTAHGSGGLRIRNLECMRLDEASEIPFYTESRWPNAGEVDEVMSHASWTRHSRPFDARVQSRRCQLARGFYEQELAAWNFVHRDVDGRPGCQQGTSAGSSCGNAPLRQLVPNLEPRHEGSLPLHGQMSDGPEAQAYHVN